MAINSKSALNYNIGVIGEDIVVKHLQSSGCEILKKRYKTKNGEIDIIALEQYSNTLIFAEIKSTTKRQIDFENTISKRQWQRIINASEDFFAKSQGNSAYELFDRRFDSFFVCGGKIIEHFKNIVIDDFVKF